MTPGEFRDLIDARTDSELLEPCLLDEQPPYVFEPEPDTWDTFRDEIVSALPITRADIRVVGSARFGFSMKPGRNLRRFTDTSDIDVVIVNQSLFDELWIALLEAAYPRSPATEMMRNWFRSRRYELYTGWLTPIEMGLDRRILGDKVRPVLEFRTRWFNALKQASRHPPRRHEDIQGRLYRTWRHAELYHLSSLADLRRSLERSI